jgi:hypothetical protein
MNSKIHNPTVELLAIKLHEQARMADGLQQKSWFDVREEDREVFREVARGDEPLDLEQEEEDPADRYAIAFDNKCRS